MTRAKREEAESCKIERARSAVLQAENERMRIALEEIDEGNAYDEPRDLRNIARAALRDVQKLRTPLSQPAPARGEEDMRPWVRPMGCECSEESPRKHRCSARWMRCNARIDYALSRVPDRKKRKAKPRKKVQPAPTEKK